MTSNEDKAFYLLSCASWVETEAKRGRWLDLAAEHMVLSYWNLMHYNVQPILLECDEQTQYCGGAR